CRPTAARIRQLCLTLVISVGRRLVQENSMSTTKKAGRCCPTKRCSQWMRTFFSTTPTALTRKFTTRLPALGRARAVLLCNSGILLFIVAARIMLRSKWDLEFCDRTGPSSTREQIVVVLVTPPSMTRTPAAGLGGRIFRDRSTLQTAL